MGFWIAVIVGVIFVWLSIQLKFHAAWIFFLNVLLSVYLAVFFTPVLLDWIPAAAEIPFGVPITLVGVFVASLLLTYGIAYACISGQFYLEIAKVPDTIFGGVLGFFSGFLICSFVLFAFSLTPLADIGGLSSVCHRDAQKGNRAYLCFWCNRVHGLVGSSERSCKDALEELLAKVPSKEAAPPEPKHEETAPSPAPAPAVVPKTEETPAVVEGKKVEKKEAVFDLYPDPTGELAEALAKGRAKIGSSDQIAAAIGNQDIRIIEISNTCTADQFQEDELAALKNWVSKGGVLWVKNDVLGKFDLEYATATKPCQWQCHVVPNSKEKEAANVLTHCYWVSLKDLVGKPRIFTQEGVNSLLALKGKSTEECKEGTVCWSMVRYGEGWISDPKVVDVDRFDSKIFWDNFCAVCLGMPLLKYRAEPIGPNTGPLTGVWKSTKTGTDFVLRDDGAVIYIGLQHKDEIVVSFKAKLIRNYVGDAVIEGEGEVVFYSAPKDTYPFQIVLTVGDDEHIKVKCTKWPVWKGGKRTFSTVTDNWVLSEFFRQ